MSGCVPMLTGAGREGYEWLWSLSLLELAERVMSGCVPMLTGAGREGMSGCVPMLTGAGREGYEWLCP